MLKLKPINFGDYAYLKRKISMSGDTDDIFKSQSFILKLGEIDEVFI